MVKKTLNKLIVVYFKLTPWHFSRYIFGQ